jgi:phage terminase small subunit
MSRGGYRANAGRKKGTKDSKPRKKSDTQEQINRLPFISKAEELAVFYKGLIERAHTGKKPTDKDKQQMNKLATELAKEYESKEEKSETPIEKLLPLEFMLKVMNDQKENKELRARMAMAAAPFVHSRMAEGKGKKQEKDDKAKSAGVGKFAPGRPPIALVK